MFDAAAAEHGAGQLPSIGSIIYALFHRGLRSVPRAFRATYVRLHIDNNKLVDQ